MPSAGSSTLNTLPTVVTGKIAAPTVVTPIHAHQKALPKPSSRGLTPVS